MKPTREPASSLPKPCASLKNPHESCPFATPRRPSKEEINRLGSEISFSLRNLPVCALSFILYIYTVPGMSLSRTIKGTSRKKSFIIVLDYRHIFSSLYLYRYVHELSSILTYDSTFPLPPHPLSSPLIPSLPLSPLLVLVLLLFQHTIFRTGAVLETQHEV